MLKTTAAIGEGIDRRRRRFIVQATAADRHSGSPPYDLNMILEPDEGTITREEYWRRCQLLAS